MPNISPPRISCIVTQNGLAALEARRWRGPVDWEAVGLSEALLNDTSASLSVEQYITFHRALARPHCGAPVPLPREHRRVGREMMAHGANGPFRHLAALNPSIAALFKTVFGWVFMGHMPMVRCEVTSVEPGRVDLHFSLDAHFPDSECLFHSFAGSAEMLPTMVKAAPAQVTLTASSHEAHLEVYYRQRDTLRARFQRRVRRTLTSGPASGEMRRVFDGLTANILLLERSNRALRQAQARWGALNRHLPGAVWLLDDEGWVVESSGVMAEALLPSRGKGSRRALLHVFDAASHRAVEDALQRLRAGATSVDFEARTAAGNVVLSCTGGPAPLDDATTLVVAQDVTARRDAEATAERSRQRLSTARRMEAIGRLAGGLAHDTNNLLMNVRGEAQLLALERPTDDELQGAMGRIMSAVDRADSLTRNALSPSDLPQEDPHTANLSTVLHTFIRSQHDASLALELMPLPPGELRVNVSESLLQRVLLNLVLNARQAIERTGVGDRITIHVRITPGPAVQLTLRDNGPGMDESTLARALEPFFTTRAQGSGLGLSNSWWSLRQLGGDLSLTSRAGAGTTAVMSLPMPTPPADRSERTSSHTRATVLLVDDEPEIRDVIRKVLESLHLHVLEAGSGAEALAHLESLATSPALLVSDLTLPRSSGHRVAADVRSQFPSVPVLFLSGVPEAEGRQSALACDAAFLRKPFRLEALQQTVVRLMAP